MPELPEILLRAREMQCELAGRTIAGLDVLQPKILNMPPEAIAARIAGQRVEGARHRGKWIYCCLSEDVLLINLGMGGEMLLHAPGEALPEKVQAVLTFSDGDRLSFHFWWFGYVHLVSPEELPAHPMAGNLGADPLDAAFTPEALGALLAGRRTRVKTLLLDQTQIAGIGNMYSHDILFRARIHPLRPANSLSADEVTALWRAIRETLGDAVALGGAKFEQNLHGEGGLVDMDWMQVGYREGEPCPRCGTTIVKIKTGSTSSFLCPSCQKAD
jgi:formamidopyrimidine-DNA glycosylase